MLISLYNKPIEVRDNLMGMFASVQSQRNKIGRDNPKDLLTHAALDVLEKICLEVMMKEIKISV